MAGSVQDYRGHKIIQHGGGTQGFRPVVVLIPEKNTGFVIVNNSEDNEFVPASNTSSSITISACRKHDWPKAFKELFDARNCRRPRGTARSQRVTARVEALGCRLAGLRCAHYADPWYGRST